MTAVQTGLKLTYYFDYSNECISSSSYTLDDVYWVHDNATLGYDNGYNYTDISFNVSEIIGGNFASGVFNCYLFYNSMDEVVAYRYSQFADFTDVYTSFLFNLLANSLQIKNLAVDLTAA